MTSQNKIYSLLHNRFIKNLKSLAVLIDPDETDLQKIINIAKISHKENIDYFFVGGSLLSRWQVDKVIDLIKQESDKPIILFPSGPMQLTPNADAVLFLSLISGRNPEFLINRLVEGAPIVKQFELEPLSTGYILIDGGNTTTAIYISGTMPIPNNKPDIAFATALAGTYLGNKLIYLDTGSGANQTVSAEIINNVKKGIDIPLIVGGGIKNLEDLKIVSNSGADIIVVGSSIEENPDNLYQFSSFISESNSRAPLEANIK
jgi:putative glycerol-1-phosphate prenyltransferase